MEFEWDPDKAAANVKKHKVSFSEAVTVFGDPLSSDFPDPDHSDDEERWLKVGTSFEGCILVVSYTEREERVRIISARQATRRERADYEEES